MPRKRPEILESVTRRNTFQYLCGYSRAYRPPIPVVGDSAGFAGTMRELLSIVERIAPEETAWVINCPLCSSCRTTGAANKVAWIGVALVMKLVQVLKIQGRIQARLGGGEGVRPSACCRDREA